MELTLDQYKKAQQYLDDKMTSEEVSAYMKEVEADISLQEYLQFEIELRNHLDVIATPNKAANEEIKPVPVIEQATKKKQTGKVFGINRMTAIAIAASLLVAVAGIIWFPNKRLQSPDVATNNSNNTKKDNNTVLQPIDTIVKKTERINYTALYKKAYTKDEAPTLQKRPDLLAEALMEYENGDYKKLQTTDFENFSSELRGDEDLQKIKELGHYYKGLSFIETGNNKQAQDNLQWVIDNGKDQKLLTKASWYQALIDVKQGDIRNAVLRLTKIADNKSAFGKKAAELLQTIKK